MQRNNPEHPIPDHIVDGALAGDTACLKYLADRAIERSWITEGQKFYCYNGDVGVASDILGTFDRMYPDVKEAV